MRLVWILSGFFLSLSGVAQTFHVSVDSNQLLIGDVRTAHLQLVGVPPTANVDSLDLSSWTQLQVEPTSFSDWKVEGDLWQRDLRFMVFDTGYILLPPLRLHYVEGRDTNMLLSNDLALDVYGITVDSTGLAPLREIRREGLNFGDVLPYLLGLCLLVALMFWYVRRGRDQAIEQVIVEVPDPPDEVALRQLAGLDAKKLWQAGKIKKYQSELTYIIRWYLEEKFRFPALESTSSEIVRYLADSEVAAAEVGVVQEVLNMADLVKFAKAKPDPTIHQEFMTKAERFVRATRHHFNTNSEEE